MLHVATIAACKREGLEMRRGSNVKLGKSKMEIGRQRSTMVQGALVLGILMLGLFIGLMNLHTSYDDSFITLRYAQNFASGNGLVFNHGERYLGTTAPFYGLLVGVLGIPEPSLIPTISGLLSVTSMVAVALGLLAIDRVRGYGVVGFLAGVFYMSSPIVLPAFNGEMIFVSALIVWAFWAYMTGRLALSGVLLGVAAATRLDSILACLLLGLHFIWFHRRIPWRLIWAVSATIVPFALAAWVYYGSPIPGTLSSKFAQRDSGVFPLFGKGGRYWLSAKLLSSPSILAPSSGPELYYLLAPFLAIGVLMLLRDARRWGLILSWAASFTLIYRLLDVPFYFWYVTPFALGIAVLMGLGVAGVGQLTIGKYGTTVDSGRDSIGWRRVLALCVLGLLVALPLGNSIWYVLDSSHSMNVSQSRAYQEVSDWLRENSGPEDSVGYFEIGYLSYYSKRNVIDALGLVNPRVAPRVADGDFEWSYRHYRPDFVVHHTQGFSQYISPVTESAWFRADYVLVDRIHPKGFVVLEIYERRDHVVNHDYDSQGMLGH